jgi:predicted RNase H-like nuclease (RuvC/YqgF family)
VWLARKRPPTTSSLFQPFAIEHQVYKEKYVSIETVVQIARQLQAEGKQPSVALIKARLPAPCPMPDVIAGIQRWRQQSAPAHQAAAAAAEQTISTPVAHSETEPQSLQSEIQQLRDEVARLREEVVMLRRSVRLLGERQE